MSNCKTCKFWTQNDRDYFHTVDNKTGRCSRIPMVTSEHFDGNEESYEMEFVCTSGELAFASDSDGYSAWIYTRADFGCVMHVDSASNAKEE